MFYSLGKGMAGGVDRAPGTFASIGGLFSYGTHRDGRYGIIDVDGKFVPTGGRYGEENGVGVGGGGGGGGGNNLNTRPDEDEQGLDKDKTSRRPRVPRGASWNQIVGAYFPRTQEPRKKIGETTTMKRGGIVRSSGMAQRGRGKGKMV